MYMNSVSSIYNRIVGNDTYVYSVSKTSIMGNYYDVTYEYFRGLDFINELDLDFTIEFYAKGNFYSISGPLEFIDEANKFLRPDKTRTTFLRAYDMETSVDITEKIKQIAGPNSDFYFDTPFKVLCKKSMLILDNKFVTHKFYKDDEIILEKNFHSY